MQYAPATPPAVKEIAQSTSKDKFLGVPGVQLTVQYRFMYSYGMERVKTETFRAELAHWLSQARKRRLLVTNRGYDYVGLCSPADIRVLERLDQEGRLEELRQSMSE